MGDHPDFKPGIIHAAATFDQSLIWVTERADVLNISEIHPNHARNIVLFLLRNASRFRRAYVAQQFALELFGAHPDDIGSLVWDMPDESPHADQRWMLERPVMRAIMVRVCDTEEQPDERPREHRDQAGPSELGGAHTDSEHIWTHPDGTPR